MPHGVDAQKGADTASGVDTPSLRLQLNALQALARQVFAFRLAMIALGTPFALARTAPGAATWLIGAAVLVTFMGSYAMWRDWERCGPLLLKHPALLGLDLLFSALLLLTATPESTLGYVTVCTPLLAGLAYGWRGAGVFAGLQILVLAAAYGANPGVGSGLAAMLVLPGFCAVAGAAGVGLRNLLLSFGAAGRALTETRARLAAAEAVGEERARLAREMHDSVAKTLHGLALAADGLAHSAGRTDTDTDREAMRHRAEMVAHAARHAAAESRELLSDLRGEVSRTLRSADGKRAEETGPETNRAPAPGPGPALGSVQGPRPGPSRDKAPIPGRVSGDTPEVSLGTVADELAARTADWSRATGIPADFRSWGLGCAPPLPGAVPRGVARQLLTIAAEALENTQRHAGASRVVVEAGVEVGTGLEAHPGPGLGLGVDPAAVPGPGPVPEPRPAGCRILRISVLDDGRGLPPGTTLHSLRAAGHFGLVGMVERAAGVGARLRIGRGHRESGTEVRVELPVAAPAPGAGLPLARLLEGVPHQPVAAADTKANKAEAGAGTEPGPEPELKPELKPEPEPEANAPTRPERRQNRAGTAHT